MTPETQHPTRCPKQIAGVLMFPGLLILAASLFLIPWMIETKRRLQDEYWETQLAFATLALFLAALGLPFLVLRFFCSNFFVAAFSWLVVLTGYAAVLTYILQSHFPLISKVVIAGGACGLIVFASRGLRYDLRRNRNALAV